MKLEKKIIILIKALCFSYIWTILLLAVLAFVLYQWEVKEKIISIVLILIYIVSTLFGGLFVGKKLGEKKFLWGILLGVFYFLLFSMLALIFNGGENFFSINTVTTAVLCIASGMLGGMLS